jgi:hypothetical protein
LVCTYKNAIAPGHPEIVPLFPAGDHLSRRARRAGFQGGAVARQKFFAKIFFPCAHKELRQGLGRSRD